MLTNKLKTVQLISKGFSAKTERTEQIRKRGDYIRACFLPPNNANNKSGKEPAMDDIKAGLKQFFSGVRALPEKEQIDELKKATQVIGEQLDTLRPILPQPNDGSYEKYSDHIKATPISERMSGEKFLKKHWEKYIVADVLHLEDLRKLDMSLVSKLYRDNNNKPIPLSIISSTWARADAELADADVKEIRKSLRIAKNAHRRGITLRS